MIFITGCARSGTTLTTSILEACGAKLGDANRLKEHRGVREYVLKDYLRLRGFDPMGQYPLPSYKDLDHPPGFREEVLRHLNGADTYKGAKMTLTWPIWVEAFPEAKWIIVRRRKEAIIDSCRRTSFMRNRSDWGNWVDHHLQCFEDLKRAAPCLEVWPDHNPETFRPSVEWAGLTWNPKAAAARIDTSKLRQ